MIMQAGARGAARYRAGQCQGSRACNARNTGARIAGPLHGKRRVVASASGGGGGSGDDAPSSSSVPDALPAAGPETDWRAYRARLAALEAASSESSAPKAASSFDDGRWAHSVPVPETGCILLAHPSMFGVSQTYFRLAAILILECSESGSLGVILNRPTEHVLRDLAFTADEDATRPFADNRLYMGGDVGQSSTIVVTSSDAVVDATEVAAGIRVCTVGAAAAAVRAGKASAQEFRFFGQYSGWGPGQLQRECKAGVWFVASVSSQLALNEKLAVGTELWHEVLMTMGGPYAELSQLVQDGERLSPGLQCSLRPEPVCGSDGLSYANACLAALAGVDALRGGYCQGERIRFASAPIGMSDYYGGSAAMLSVAEANKFADAGFKLTGRLAMLPFRGPPPRRERAFVRNDARRSAPGGSAGPFEVVAYRAAPPGDFYVAKFRIDLQAPPRQLEPEPQPPCHPDYASGRTRSSTARANSSSATACEPPPKAFVTKYYSCSPGSSAGSSAGISTSPAAGITGKPWWLEEPGEARAGGAAESTGRQSQQLEARRRLLVRRRQRRRLRAIVGSDDRTLCPPSQWPYTATGQIDVGGGSSTRDGGGSDGGLTCSGVLIGPDAVLTAAHCVWDAWRGGFHNSLRFAAGRHNASGCAVSSPFGAVQWRHITMFASFADSLEPDLAVVRLAVPVGLYTGWAGVRATACGDAQPLRVQLVGYGASGDGSDGDGGGGGQGDAGASFLPGSCLQSSCEVGAACGPGGGSGGSGNEGGASEGATTVDHTCDAQPGQSGSPMVDDEGYVRLVHRAGTLAFDGRAAGGGNAATLITPHILAALGQW